MAISLLTCELPLKHPLYKYIDSWCGYVVVVVVVDSRMMMMMMLLLWFGLGHQHALAVFNLGAHRKPWALLYDDGRGGGLFMKTVYIYIYIWPARIDIYLHDTQSLQPEDSYSLFNRLSTHHQHKADTIWHIWQTRALVVQSEYMREYVKRVFSCSPPHSSPPPFSKLMGT